MGTVVVTVHGLWLRGHEAALLRRRLARALGARCRSFSYSSTSVSLAANAAALGRYLRTLEADTIHLVAHSLGGLVVLKLFELEASREPASRELPPGRVVLLGSPVGGSFTARRLARWAWGQRLMGHAGDALTRDTERHWDGRRELGIIAGGRSVGLGRLLGPLAGPNDGTVLLSETRLAGSTQELTLRVSHTGLPFSAEVARLTAAFLRTGRFE